MEPDIGLHWVYSVLFKALNKKELYQPYVMLLCTGDNNCDFYDTNLPNIHFVVILYLIQAFV